MTPRTYHRCLRGPGTSIVAPSMTMTRFCMLSSESSRPERHNKLSTPFRTVHPQEELTDGLPGIRTLEDVVLHQAWTLPTLSSACWKTKAGLCRCWTTDLMGSSLTDWLYLLTPHQGFPPSQSDRPLAATSHSQRRQICVADPAAAPSWIT